MILRKLLLSLIMAVSLPSCAIALENESVTPNSSNEVDHFEIAGQDLANKRYQKAADEYSLALKLKPKDAKALEGRALALAYLAKYPEAIIDYNHSIKLDPTNFDAIYGRGAVFVRMGEHKKSIKDFDRALAISPQNTDAFYSRAGEYVALGEFDKAIADYDATITIDPKYFDAYYEKAITLRNLGQLKKAIEECKKALLLEDEKPSRLYFILGALYSQTRENDKALDLFNKVLRDNPKDAYSYMSRAFISFGQGNTSAAIDDFSNYLKFAESSDISNIGYITVCRLLAQKQVDEKRYRESLDLALDSVNKKEFAYSLLEFLAGKKTASQIFAKAKDDDAKVISSRCYIGINELLSGNPAGIKNLSLAVEKGNPRHCEYQLAQDMKERSSEILLSVLFKSIYQNDVAKAKEVLGNGVDCTLKDSQDNCALITAAIHGNPEFVKLFLEKGADPDQKLSDGRTALYFAAMSPISTAKSSTDRLIKEHAENLEIIKMLVAKGADPNATDKYGITPLMNAASTGNVSAVKFLLENKANASAVVTEEKIDPAGGHTIARKGDTAAMLAARKFTGMARDSAPANEIVELLERASK